MRQRNRIHSSYYPSFSWSFFCLLWFVLCLPLLTLLPVVSSHAPLGGDDNDNLAAALTIPDPTKSWVLYSLLDGPESAKYYSMSYNANERIYVILQVSPSNENSGFSPSLVLMGPGIGDQGKVPGFVEVANGTGMMVVTGVRAADAYYEGFSPSTFYRVAGIDMAAPSSGTYYLAVFDDARGGDFSIAIGNRESFTLQEWIFIPLNLITIYQWEGQSLPFIFAPMIFVVSIGLVLIWRRIGTFDQKPFQILGSVAGFFFLGTALTTLVQTFFVTSYAGVAPDVLISLTLALVPGLLGFATLRQTLCKKSKIGRRARLFVVIYGFLAIFAWAGLLMGPALAIFAGIIPPKAPEKA